MEISLVGLLQLLSEYLGLPVSTILILLGIVMFLGYSSFGILSFGTYWGGLLGVFPIMLGVFLGWFPVWMIFIGIIPVLSILHRSFYGLGSMEEEEEVSEVLGVPRIPKAPSSRSKFGRKPPWAK